MRRKICFLAVLLLLAGQVWAADSGCRFQRGDTPSVPAHMKSVRMLDYFRIHYSATDPVFAETDRNGIPTALQAKESLMKLALHLLQVELGWKVPAARMELGHPELDVFFVAGPDKFTGTAEAGRIVLNRSVLSSDEFASLFVHQLAHAAELQYRASGDYWFYEATAGWIEGQLGRYSRAFQEAAAYRLEHPEVSLTDPAPQAALGAARFVEMLGRPYKDVIRQCWDQWGFSKDETLIAVIDRVLALNHLPDFESYLLNYFLLSNGHRKLDGAGQRLALRPYSAAVLRGHAEGSSGGTLLSFLPAGNVRYSVGLLFFAQDERSGTLALKKGLSEPWSIQIPYAGMDHYDLVVVNCGAQPLGGIVLRAYDSGIPAVLEYFRVNPGEGGIEIEWKTVSENGVAFWNLYRVEQGKKVLMNAFPIPATIHSDQGMHYLFVDSSEASFYSLEAITSEGLAGPSASAETPK